MRLAFATIAMLCGIAVLLCVRGYVLFKDSELTEGEVFWTYLAWWVIGSAIVIGSAAIARACRCTNRST
jgi:hypothetical protein